MESVFSEPQLYITLAIAVALIVMGITLTVRQAEEKKSLPINLQPRIGALIVVLPWVHIMVNQASVFLSHTIKKCPGCWDCISILFHFLVLISIMIFVHQVISGLNKQREQRYFQGL